MILQALQEYYERLKNEGTDDLEMEGFKRVEIPFLIVIRHDGSFVGIDDTRGSNGKGRPFFVPKVFEGSRTVNVKANLLWDKASYVFGVNPKAKPERLIKQKQKFRETIEEFFPESQAFKGVSAVLQFLDRHAKEVESHPMWLEIADSDPNLAFRLEDQNGLIADTDDIKAVFMGGETGTGKGICLITGKVQPSVRLENPIKGLRGSGKAESHLVAFNESAYWSYGKTDKIRNANAPIGKAASFAYVAAINYLQRQKRLYIGDASTVFWAERPHKMEDVFADIFGEPAKDNPVQDVKPLIAMFRSPETGARTELDRDTKFYALGLSPNAARIAIRFWYSGTVGDIAENIWQHFEDCEIVHSEKQPPTLSLFRLLASTAMQGKSENIQPNLAGDFMKAILSGSPYPQTLLVAAVNRIKAEREITYPRVALIKAVLVRYSRFYNKEEKEAGMSLDQSNTNTGYRLGRLFAVLEKIQEEASPGINATIRDRFYGAASSTPVAAYPHLMKLKNHHLTKLESRGRAVNLEKLIGEIMDGINDFPTHLSLQDQGRFAVGYYHQRQDLFTKKDNQ